MSQAEEIDRMRAEPRKATDPNAAPWWRATQPADFMWTIGVTWVDIWHRAASPAFPPPDRGGYLMRNLPCP